MGSDSGRSLWRSLCCCCCDSDESEERQPLISEAQRDPVLCYQEQMKRRRLDDETFLWSEPHDATHRRSPSDLVVARLAEQLRHARRDAAEWTELNGRLQAVMQLRREIDDRWKLVLGQLGFRSGQEEELLRVNATQSPDDLRHVRRARDLLLTLERSSYLFDELRETPLRYVYVLDRLVELDMADAFVSKAQELFPKEGGKSPPSGRRTRVRVTRVSADGRRASLEQGDGAAGAERAEEAAASPRGSPRPNGDAATAVAGRAGLDGGGGRGLSVNDTNAAAAALKL